MSRITLVAFDLKAARKKRGLSQIETAKILCATQPSVSRWEAEGTLPELARKAWDQHWKLEDVANGKAKPARDRSAARVAGSRTRTKRNKEDAGQRASKVQSSASESAENVPAAGESVDS